MRFQGKEALGSASRWRKGGDIIELGADLDARRSSACERELPVGLELAQVDDQPQAVQRSVNEFVRSLTEAVVIVLAVSFAVASGLRTGLVVALSIPLVLAVTFLVHAARSASACTRSRSAR